jgi:hypothetical protein
MEKEDIISVQRAQEDVETSYNLLNNNNIGEMAFVVGCRINGVKISASILER